MTTEQFIHERPELRLINRTQAQQIWKSSIEFNGANNPELQRIATEAIDVAQKIGPRICALPENRRKDGLPVEGFEIGIAINEPNSPALIVQIGKIEIPDEEYGEDGKSGKYPEFADLKIEVIQKNPGFISSGQNKEIAEERQIKSSKGVVIPDGAIAVGPNNRYVISTSGFGNAKMDAATSVAIAVGVGSIRAVNMEDFASKNEVDCRAEFMKIQDILIEEVLH